MAWGKKLGLSSGCSLIFQQGVRRNLALISSLCLCSKRNSCMLIFHRASVSMKFAKKWFTVYWLQIPNLCSLLMELIRKMGLSWLLLPLLFPCYFTWQRFICRQDEKSGIWTAMVLIFLWGHCSVCLSFCNKKRIDWPEILDKEWVLFGKLLFLHKLQEVFGGKS